MEMITTIITTTRLMVVMMVVMEQRRRWRWWPDCTFWGNCPSWSGEQWEIWCGKSVPIPRKIWTALRWQNCLIFSFIIGPIQCSWKKLGLCIKVLPSRSLWLGPMLGNYLHNRLQVSTIWSHCGRLKSNHGLLRGIPNKGCISNGSSTQLTNLLLQ